jgi:two-component system CitB family sensor kinase
MLIELGKPEQAVRLATAEQQIAQQLADQLIGAVEEPALAALLLGKVAAAHEKGVELLVTPDTAVRSVAVDMRDLVTLVGNLLDNAIDAALAGSKPKRVMFTARQDSDTLLLRVADSGQGLDPEHAQEVFTRGWSTKPANRLHGRGLGLSLVGQVVNKYAGAIDVSNNGGAVFTVRLPVGVSYLILRRVCRVHDGDLRRVDVVSSR